MARFTPEQQDKIRAAFEAHQKGGKDLTARGYAAAAGIDRNTAAVYLRRFGYPVLSSHATAAPSTSDGEKKAEAPGDPTTSTTPPDGGVHMGPPPTGGAVPQVDAATVARIHAELRSLPPQIAAGVEQVLQQHLKVGPGGRAKSPAQAAQERAQQELTAAYTEGVTAQAIDIFSWDMIAGEAARRAWNHPGAMSAFPGGPGEMIRTAFEFLWIGREELPVLQEENDDLREQLSMQSQLLNPELRREAETDKVWKMVLTAAISGSPIPPEHVTHMMRVATAVADRAEIPLPSVPITVAPRLVAEGGR